MSVPIPVITKHITAESRSQRNPNGIERWFVAIQEPSEKVKAVLGCNSVHKEQVTRKLKNTAHDASIPANLADTRPPRYAAIEPSSGERSKNAILLSEASTIRYHLNRAASVVSVDFTLLKSDKIIASPTADSAAAMTITKNTVI